MENVLAYEYYPQKQDAMMKFICSLANMLKIKYTRDARINNNLLETPCFEIKSLENIHEFLGKCVHKAKETLFRTNTISRCCQTKKEKYKFIAGNCDNQLCNECIVCQDCEIRMISMSDGRSTACPMCRSRIIISDNNVFGIDLTDLETNVKPYEEFILNLNRFYTNIIELMFSNQNKPQEKSIEAVLKILTEGRIQTHIDNQNINLKIDSDHKLLILQILFKNYSNLVEKHLNRWFLKCEPLFESAVQAAFFFQSCVYDKYFHDLTNKSDDDQLELGLKITDEILVHKDRIKVVFMEKSKSYNVDYLVIVGKLKCCMEIMAYFCNSPESLNNLSDLKKFQEFNEKMRILIEETKQDTLYNYLIKILIRKYGSASIKNILSNDESKWITPNRIIGDNLTVNDNYILIGNEYNEIKIIITDCFKENSANKFEEFLNKHNTNDQAPFKILPYICMALYQNVTLLYREMNEVPCQMFALVLNKVYPYHKDHWQPILENTLTHKLVINENTWREVELNLMLTQLKYSILFSKSKLIKPLSDLIKSPLSFLKSYFPTMPQDSIFDIKNAIIAGNQTDAPKFYLCPNNHPYVLFDCGKPWVVVPCKVCNAQIGGQNHKLLEGNKELDIKDNTARGYCLREAATLKEEPETERLLNTSQFSLVRFFLHACLYFACDKFDKEMVFIMIEKPTDKKEFFWKHMNLDLRIACKALNLNKDEILILIHTICKDILKSYNNSRPETWNTKDDRQLWESTFSEIFLKPVLNNPNVVITNATEILNSEKKLDDQSKKVYFMAYERMPEKMEKESLIYENTKFWKYMPNLNFNMMKIELMNNTKPEEYLILKEFIKKSKKLKLLSHLPQIMRFINFLQETYYKSLFKHYAYNNSIKSILEDHTKHQWTQENIKDIIEGFQTVWSSCKTEMAQYINENIPIAQQCSLDLNFKFSLDSKISCFLLATHGDGLYIYSLIHFLGSIHNDTLSFYYKKKSIDFETFEINQFDNSENIILFEEKNDLLRIIQSNFTFDSKNSKCKFRYDNISQQICERYFQQKPLIDMKRLATFEYADEINDSSVLHHLNDIISQENLELSVQAEVFTDFKNVNEVSEALNMLKTLINFGKTMSVDNEQYLSKFIQKIYVDNSQRNFEQVLKTSIIEKCQMKHLKHICVILMMKKALIYTLEDQDPFQNLNGMFKNTEEIELLLSFNQIQIISFAIVIFQLISFQLIDLKEEEELGHYQVYKMSDMFWTLECNPDILLPENYTDLINLIPDNILLKNINMVWLKLVDLIKNLD